MAKNFYVKELVSLYPGYDAEVRLNKDFCIDNLDSEINIKKIQSYYPKPDCRRSLLDISEGLIETSEKRSFLITGNYGTGKSHLGLIIANYFSLPSEDERLESLFSKIRERDPTIAQRLKDRRKGGKPYLIVIPDFLNVNFENALVKGLKEAFEKVGIDFNFNTKYKSVVDYIKNIERDSEEIFNLLGERLKNKYSLELNQLKESLNKKLSEKDYKKFCEIYKICIKVDFDPYLHMDINALYEEAVKVIKKSGYAGIVVIYDEFGPSILNNLKDFPDMGLKIQEFAGFCNDSAEDLCFFIAISHLSMADYATRNIRKELEKIEGRFETKVHHLSAFGPETEDLIDTMTKNEGKSEVWEYLRKNSNIYELVDLVESRNLFEGKRDRNEIRETIIEGCYPLHPMTTFCLPYLADKVSQKTRSMFKFFSRLNIEGSLYNFIETQPVINDDGRLNLYTLDYLFDYFKNDIEKSKNDDVIEVYKNFQLTYQNVGEQAYLTRRALKSMAVLRIINVEKLKPSLEILADSLDLNEKERQLLKENLLICEKEKDILVKKPVTGEYEFIGADLPKIGDYLEKEVQRIKDDFNLIAFLNSNFPLNSIKAKDYNREKHMNRKIKCEYTNLELLENPNDYFGNINNYYKCDQPYWGDGLVLYLILEKDEEIEKSKEMLVKEEWKHNHIIYAVPKKNLDLNDLAVELSALDRLTTYDEFSNETWAQLINKKRQIKNEEIKKCLDELTSTENLIFISKSRLTSSLRKGEEEKICDELMYSLFPDTLKINNDRIAYHYETQDSRRGIVPACNLLLHCNGKIDLNTVTEKEVETILLESLVYTGFAKKVAHKVYKITKPIDDVALKIWTVFEQALEKKEECIPIYDRVIYPLRFSPFGLSNHAIRILLSAYLSDKTDRLVIYNNVIHDGRITDNYEKTGETIFKLLKNPINYSFYFHVITEEEKHYVEEILKLLDDKLEGTKDIFEECVEKIRNWYYKLPTIARLIQLEDKSLEAIRSLLEDEGVSPKSLINSKLFKVFEVEKELPNSRYKVIEKLKVAMEMFSNLKNKIQNRLKNELCELFKAEGKTDSDLHGAVSNWYNNEISESARLHTFHSSAKQLMQVASMEGPIIDRMLIELPKALGLGSFLDWEEDKTRSFIDYIRAAKTEVENYREAKETQEEPIDKEVEFMKRIKEFISLLASEYQFSIDNIKKLIKKILEEF